MVDAKKTVHKNQIISSSDKKSESFTFDIIDLIAPVKSAFLPCSSDLPRSRATCLHMQPERDPSEVVSLSKAG